jgi:hypothetical protein
MKLRVACSLLAVAALSAPVALAQTSKTFVFGTYYYCTQAKAERADAIFKDHVAPLLKAEIAAGRISAFGWGKHWEGGEWRRLEYTAGKDLDKMVDAREAVIKKLAASDQAKIMEELQTICASHDDYIWASVVGSQNLSDVGRVRSPVAMSTYYVNDQSSDDEANEIVKTALAPILNQHVKEGKIASWNWLEHQMGGKYRHLLVIDGADHKSLLNYWGVLAPAFSKAQPELYRRFGQLCFSHSDYIWDMTTN